MSDELCFQYSCGGCLSSFNSGYVLSCADFICGNCFSNLEFATTRICPQCQSTNVNAVALADPPGEVAEMIGNPACEIEKLFNVLKFQISHYKKIITTVNQKVQCLQKEKQTLQRNEQKLKAILGKKQSHDGPQSLQHPMGQQREGLQWNSGSGQQPHASGNQRRPATSSSVRSPLVTVNKTEQWPRPTSSGFHNRQDSMGQLFPQPCESRERSRSHIISSNNGGDQFCPNISSSSQPSCSTTQTHPVAASPHHNSTPGNGTVHDSARPSSGHYSSQYRLKSPSSSMLKRPRSSLADSLNGTKRIKTPDQQHDKNGSNSITNTQHGRNATMKRPNTTGSGRLRSPYLPYIRTPGKAVKLSQTDIV